MSQNNSEIGKTQINISFIDSTNHFLSRSNVAKKSDIKLAANKSPETIKKYVVTVRWEITKNSLARIKNLKNRQQKSPKNSTYKNVLKVKTNGYKVKTFITYFGATSYMLKIEGTI